MRIGVDIYPLLRDFKGISISLYQTLAHLSQLDQEDEFFLYACPSSRLRLPPLNNARWHLRIRRGLFRRGATLWMQTGARRDLGRDKIDIFWGTQGILPLNLPSDIKSVLTVYDLTFYFYPSTMSWKNRIIMPLFSRRSLLRADRVVAISDSVAKDLKEIFPFLSQRVSSIYLGLRQELFSCPSPEEARAYVASRYNTSPDYILAVGTVEPRKNIANLLRAYLVLKEVQPRFNYQLLIAGGGGWRNSAIYKTYRRLKLCEREVKFLGYVPEEDLARLYGGAALFVFASLYEGFGLPILEAFAAGVPVVASDIPVFREIAADAAFFADTSHPAPLALAMFKVLTNSQLREQLTRRGRERVGLFAWRNTAKKMFDLFREFR